MSSLYLSKMLNVLLFFIHSMISVPVYKLNGSYKVGSPYTNAEVKELLYKKARTSFFLLRYRVERVTSERMLTNINALVRS